MGSEGRKEDPSQEVAANDLIYDGIVFRGSDVKDLSILAAPAQSQVLNDPAIVQQQQQVSHSK
jgi:protein LSM14